MAAVRDGDEPLVTWKKLAPYEVANTRILTVEHRYGKLSMPVGAQNLIGPVPGLRPRSLLDMAAAWDVDLDEIVAATTMPDGSSLPDNFLDGAAVYDLALTSVDERLLKDSRVLHYLYRAALGCIASKDGDFIVGVMGTKGIYDPIATRGPEAWTEFAGIDRRVVLSRVQHSDVSTGAVGNVKAWQAQTAIHKPQLNRLFWGDTLARRGALFTDLAEPKPSLFDTKRPNPRLTPARLHELPYETPTLYMDPITMGEAYRDLQEALPNVALHYAVKCNNDPQVVATLQEFGSKFEVASIAELQQLMEQGVRAEDVLFSNPVKIARHIKKAYAAGLYRFAVDSPDELAKIAEEAPHASVYVRLATPPQDSQVGSEGKFGVNVEQAEHLMKEAGRLGLQPYGVTFHVGSQTLNPNAWRHAIRMSGELMTKLGEAGIRNLSMLDVGGGFPERDHGRDIPSIDEIGYAITSSLEELPYVPPLVVAEPGRFLVAGAGVIVSEVTAVAERAGTNFAHLDLGGFVLFEVLESGGSLRFPMADSRQSARRKEFTIAAASCDTADKIGEELLSADLRRGDRVYIGSAGAYTNYVTNFNGFPVPTVQMLPEV